MFPNDNICSKVHWYHILYFFSVPESLNTSHLKQHCEKILKSPSQFCSICIDSTSSWHGDHLIVVEGTMILTLK